MKHLMEILFTKTFRNYSVKRIKQMIDWQVLFKDNGYFDSIVLCILKAQDMSRDNIVAITKGWIFDGNLTYALSLNDNNLTHFDISILFTTLKQYYEQSKLKTNRIGY